MGQIGINNVSRAAAYGLEAGVDTNNSALLPQKIAVIAEMNTANQATPLTPTVITSLKKAAELYGYGSPMYQGLREIVGNTTNEVTAFPVLEAVSATPKTDNITVSGTATANTTHTLLIEGKSGTDFGSYDINVVTGDTAATVAGKIETAINETLACPLSAVSGAGIATTTLAVGGTGYATNDTFTVNTGSTLATGRVTAQTAGVVTAFTILTYGIGYSVATGVATTATSGSGSGLTINVTAIRQYAYTSTVWKGISANSVTINILTNGNDAGLTYTITSSAAGSGLPSVQPALDEFGNTWYTIVVDGIGILNNAANLTRYITYNGNPDTKSGQYDPLVMQPAVYIVGDVTDTDVDTADTVITEGYADELTIAVASAPKSLDLPVVIAARYAVTFSNISANSPNIDIQGLPMTGIAGPLPTDSAPLQSNNYTLRNALVKLGMTTVIYNRNTYYPQDFVTTYAPEGELVPAWKYPRDIMIDLNIRHIFRNLQESLIANKQIANDNDQVTATNVVKPKDIKAALVTMASDIEALGFITNKDSMIASIRVTINSANRNRFDIEFSYERSGVTRVISTVATAR